MRFWNIWRFEKTLLYKDIFAITYVHISVNKAINACLDDAYDQSNQHVKVLIMTQIYIQTIINLL